MTPDKELMMGEADESEERSKDYKRKKKLGTYPRQRVEDVDLLERRTIGKERINS